MKWGENMAFVNVLSIDGGGVKAVVSAILLERLEGLLQKNSGNKNARLADFFDLIAGTSSGAILAAMYLCPGSNGRARYSANEVLRIFLENHKSIFTKQTAFPINTLFGLFGAKYSNKKLMGALNKYLGNVKLSQLAVPCMITAYDTEKGEAVFFNSLSAKKGAGRDYYLKDAVLASTAAPTYFPPVLISPLTDKKSCLIDGGVFSSNPAMCAFVEAFKLPKVPGPGDISMLSVGNVSARISFGYDTIKSWGIAQWAKPLFDIIMDANAQTVDYQMRQIFKGMKRADNYLRIEMRSSEGEVPRMDDTSDRAVKRLVEMGEKLADQVSGALDRYSVHLIMSKGA